MPTYLAEPEIAHGTPAYCAVPDQPRHAGSPDRHGTPPLPEGIPLRPARGRDPRPIWWLILNGIILNTRPKASAEKYAAIWTPTARR